jgi:palmitoyltransferase
MLKGEHSIPSIVVVMMVYGIIFGEYYAFMVLFIPAFY